MLDVTLGDGCWRVFRAGKAKTNEAGRNLCTICWPQDGIVGKIGTPLQKHVVIVI